MTDHELDLCYSALSKALGQAGQAQAPLLLSMLSLQLIARQDSAQAVLPLIEKALSATLANPDHG